ncbi:helix-turn-helix domain-containing protein [Sinorhizobium fredii]
MSLHDCAVCAYTLPYATLESRQDRRAMNMDLSEIVRAWRQRQGITVNEAARRLGIPVRTLDGIAQGRPFRYERMMRLAIERLEARDGDAS